MKLRPGFLILAFGLAACGGADTGEQAESMPAAESSEMPSADAAIDQVRMDYVSAFNSHDAAAVAALFTDSATVLSANGAVEDGREAIQAALTEQMAGSPMAQIEQAETLVFGDMAISRGTYTVNSTAADGTAMSVSGSYMSGLEQKDGAWKIDGLITNLNAPPPEGYPMASPTGDEPPENGTMKALADAYSQALNAGDAAAVAALFTDDAVMAFANEPASSGKVAIQASVQASLSEGSPKLTIHDVYTGPLDDTHSVDVGWYTVTATTPDGEVTTGGSYVLLCEKGMDGNWKIKWGVANSHPAAM